jgi:hypothetical protein
MPETCGASFGGTPLCPAVLACALPAGHLCGHERTVYPDVVTQHGTWNGAARSEEAHVAHRRG